MNEENRIAPKGTNQFIKAKEAGLPTPKAKNQFTKRGSDGKRVRTEHDQATRDKVRAEWAMMLLERQARGKSKLSRERLRALETILEYGKAKIAAVQEKPAIVEPTEAELEEQTRLIASTFPAFAAKQPIENCREIVRAILAKHPSMMQEFSIRPVDVAAKAS